MLTDEQTADIAGLLVRLDIELRNGDVPGATATMTSLDVLLHKTDLPKWPGLLNICCDVIQQPEGRVALLHLLPAFKDFILQPMEEQIAPSPQ